MLRLRSDDQLLALFRDGHDEAFRAIHDRYQQRLFAYTRQMLHGSRQDAEDALQDVFVRAYAGLRASDRDLALRAWLYRVAHNRCIDELRRPIPPALELIELVRPPVHDPIVQAEQRESLRRLIAEIRRLPNQQRSALLMRELSGMTYSELADALGVSVAAVKSLLVRARVSLAQSMQARDTACSEIQGELTLAHDRGVRPNGTARRHLRDCASCRSFRSEVRGTSRQLAALVPAFGPAWLLANVLGIGGGTGTGAAAGGGVAATGAVGGGGIVAAGGLLASGAGHIATLLAAAAVAAGGAVEFQHTLMTSPVVHHPRHAISARAAVEPTGGLAVAAASAVSSTLAGHGTSLPPHVSASAAAGPNVIRQPVSGRPHARARQAQTPSPAGTATSSLVPNPNGVSSFADETGVGPIDISSATASSSGSLAGITAGTIPGDSTSPTGSSASSATGASSTTTGASSLDGTTTGAGASTTSSASSAPTAGTASAGASATSATSAAGSGHSIDPQQSTSTSRR